ncbi:diacylglycerol kinase [Secundilactobacillus odoratitofui DSM 19909 = JCM 15043]|uniref:Diacylglycerol kinase n=1 Tax=Secundilactobacillus odoratitofui DSM 19909 = JCM 15043 TaxID=1423776 RepID=A0A0R1LRL9_9LACO|nr:diacylglycerol kinase family protein [Secundilactobacillus odoratitofui]KRK98144.1 diacylglycerol kinase [Secundilactobacillus odoratitofui DSM 19909 = JCM 15043]
MGLHDKQINKNKSFWQSFKHAFIGVYSLISTERNFRKHIVMAIIAVLLGVWLHLDVNEWLWVTLAIFVVVVAEVLNTVVEAIVDLIVGRHFDAAAKKAKDVAAGGVLIAALFAVIIGCLIFIPELLQQFKLNF